MEAQLPYLLNGLITFPWVRLLGAQIGWGRDREIREVFLEEVR